MPSILCERWDIALSTFPFIEAPGTKLRPILVLSSRDFNLQHGLVVAAMITTASAGRWASDHPVIDLASAGLTRNSVVRWKIFTLPTEVIARRLGTLSQADQALVLDQLDAIFPRTA